MNNKILICGFDGSKNPSKLLIEVLKQEIFNKKIQFIILRSAYESIENQLREEISDFKPDYIILTGVSLEKKSITIERVAVNIDDSGLKDSDGIKRNFQSIVANGIPAFFTKFPVIKLYNSFEELNIPVRYSNYAGNFLCNHAYYLSFSISNDLGIPAKICFLHIPQILEYGGKNKNINISSLKRGILKVVETTLDV
jgi:pyroglutamyl-peptidase